MKRTNRTAWGAVAVLAAVLLGGVGGMLTHGIRLGSRYYGMYWSGKWATGPDVTGCDLCTCGASFHLGYLTLYEDFPDPACVTLRSQASSPSGTGR